MTHKQSTEETKSIKSLIAAGRDDFDIWISIELKQLTERIQDKRSISTQAAGEIARELLQHEVKAK